MIDLTKKPSVSINTSIEPGDEIDLDLNPNGDVFIYLGDTMIHFPLSYIKENLETFTNLHVKLGQVIEDAQRQQDLNTKT